MIKLHFKSWLEDYTLFGGLEPSKQLPVDPTPAAGQTDAFPRFHTKGSKELPPTPKNKKMKKK